MDSLWNDPRLLNWCGWLASSGVIIALVVFVRSRVIARGVRLQRFAKRHGFRWLGRFEEVPPAWCDLACFFVTTSTHAENAIAGERRGRAFTLVDWHYDVPSLVDGQSHAYRRGILFDGGTSDGPALIDGTRDPGFSAVVVECRIPPGTRTSHAKRGLAPWTAEFGAYASVLRLHDGYCSPARMLAAVDRLNDRLDAILAGVTESAA